MMCMTELHGGVCHRTSTPHKNGNKMKEKKKKSAENKIFEWNCIDMNYSRMYVYYAVFRFEVSRLQPKYASYKKMTV